MRTLSRTLTLRGHKKAANCPRPSYGRVLGSDVVGGVVTALVTFAGFGAGIMVARATESREGVGGFIGGGVGLLASIYPSMLAQRATLRNDDCPHAGLKDILIYTLVRNAVNVTTAYAARAVLPKPIAPVVPLGLLFAMPLIGKSILRT